MVKSVPQNTDISFWLLWFMTDNLRNGVETKFKKNKYTFFADDQLLKRQSANKQQNEIYAYVTSNCLAIRYATGLST
jgi:hypothetical protein